MPIGFRCTGCRARLHVPTRWGGTTVPCPKCGTRVVVPAATPTIRTGAFEQTAVERSLATLQPPPRSAGGIFADESFELPVGEVDEASGSGHQLSAGITLPRSAVYALAATVPIVAAAAFCLGYWWAAGAGREPLRESNQGDVHER
jgi:hypothetical protein